MNNALAKFLGQVVLLALVFACFSVGNAWAQDPLGDLEQLRPELPPGLAAGPEGWTSREGLTSTLQVLLLLTVITLAPTILLMTTSFIRILVVMSLLRQAIGTPQLPPSQVMICLALFMSLMIMMPVWTEVYNDGVLPYTEGKIGLDEAWQRGQEPVRKFMALQIERTRNTDDVWLFLDYMHASNPSEDESIPDYVYFGAEAGEENVPLAALLPAFMLSELKTAFLIGFQIYLPFIVIDMVIASVAISMGMLMLPPQLVSLPFKLLLFVMVDGWHLVVEMLLKSFEPFV